MIDFIIELIICNIVFISVLCLILIYFGKFIKLHIVKTQIRYYLKSNNLREIQYKTGNYDNNKNYLIADYLDRIKTLNNFESSKLKDLTNIIDKRKIFNDTKWNFAKTIRNIEFSFPFTIGNTILLSKEYILTKNNTKLIKTLIHEKIHINQRNNQKIYNEMYKTIFKNIIEINPNNLESSNQNIITNPDANNSVWLIKHNGNLYLVPYIYSPENGLVSKNKAFLIIETNNGKKYFMTDDKINVMNLGYYKKIKNQYKIDNVNLTHPNETFVDLILHSQEFIDQNSKYFSLINHTFV